MDDSDGRATLSDSSSQDSTITQKNATKPKRRSLVERELETNLTARVTSPVITDEGNGGTSRYGRTRRLKVDSDTNDSAKLATMQSLQNPKLPVYKMHASNSPIKLDMTPSASATKELRVVVEKQIDTIDLETESLSRFAPETSNTDSSAKTMNKVYVKKDLIQGKSKDIISSTSKILFSPIKSSRPSTNTHLNLVLERSMEKYSCDSSNKKRHVNGYVDSSSVVKMLDFDSGKKKKKENLPRDSKSDIFEREAKCNYQVGDLGWARVGTYPFWPCIVTRDPYSDTFVKKKLFGRVEHEVIHVTFFGDNGRRGWIVDNMLRRFTGRQEFETAREQFTPEAKKKEPRLYAAYFISDKKQATWNISVEEAESLQRQPKRLRIDALYDLLNKSKETKTTPKRQKSSKISRTDSDVSLSASLYDTLFSEDDCKEDLDKSKNRSRKTSLDVSEVVTACLDNMAAKTGMAMIQKQSHMDIWLQKAKSMTPEKLQGKLVTLKNKAQETKTSARMSKTPLKENTPQKGYSLRRSGTVSCGDHLGSVIVSKPLHINEHDYSKLSRSESTIPNTLVNETSDDSRAVIGVIDKVDTLSSNSDYDKENNVNVELAIDSCLFVVDTRTKVDGLEKKMDSEVQKHVNDDMRTESNLKSQEGVVMDVNVQKCTKGLYEENDNTISTESLTKNKKASPFRFTTNGTHIVIEPISIRSGFQENSPPIVSKENSALDVIGTLEDDSIDTTTDFISQTFTQQTQDSDNDDTANLDNNKLDNHHNVESEEENIKISQEFIDVAKESSLKTDIVKEDLITPQDKCEASSPTDYELTSDKLEKKRVLNGCISHEKTKDLEKDIVAFENSKKIVINGNIYFEIDDIGNAKKDLCDLRSDNIKFIKTSFNGYVSGNAETSKKEISENKEMLKVDPSSENSDDFILRFTEPSSNDISDHEDLEKESQTFTEAHSFVNIENSAKSLRNAEFFDNKNEIMKNTVDAESIHSLDFMSQTFTQTDIDENSSDSISIDKILLEDTNVVNVEPNKSGDSDNNGVYESSKADINDALRSDNIKFIKTSFNGYVSGKAETSKKEISENKEMLKVEPSSENSDDFILRLTEPSSNDISDHENLEKESQTFTEVRSFVNIENSTKSLRNAELFDNKNEIMKNTVDAESIDSLDFMSQTFTQPDIDEKSSDSISIDKIRRKDNVVNVETNKSGDSENNGVYESSQQADINNENVINDNKEITIEINEHNSLLNVMNEKHDEVEQPINDLKSDTQSLDSNIEDNIPLANISKRIAENCTDKNINKIKDVKRGRGRPRKNLEKSPEEKRARRDADFIKYMELHQDALLDENPHFTEEDITSYLYKIWTYEENLKSHTRKIDELEHSTLIKGLGDKAVPKTKKTKLNRKKKVEKNEDSFYDDSSDEDFELLLEIDSKTDESDIENSIPTSKIVYSPKNDNSTVGSIIESTHDKETIIEIHSETKADETKIKSSKSKPKMKVKHKSENDMRTYLNKAMADPEFIKYLELRQDSLIDENPHLTEEDIAMYLYKTWIYEEGLKPETVKNDEVEQSNMIKGLKIEPVQQPKKVKKNVEKNDAPVIAPKDKAKRRIARAFYNENDTDVEEELEIFEIFKMKPKTKPHPIETIKDSPTTQTKGKPITDTEIKMAEVADEAVETENEVEIYDEVEFYFSELTRTKPNLFKGLFRERICEICEKTGNLVKCKGPCAGSFHIDCIKKLVEKTVSLPIQSSKKRKRKKPRGIRPKNVDDLESQSDERSQGDISIDEELTLDAGSFEFQSSAKMKELLETEDKLGYDYSSSEEMLSWNDIEAGKCEIVDVKLKLRKTNDYADFKCHHCSTSYTPLCFVCKSATSPKNSTELRQRCQVPHCHTYYHLECLEFWPQTQFNSGESPRSKKVSDRYEAMSCPRHVCHTCVSDDPRGCKTRFSGDKLARCVRCPATYHSFTKCLPAGSTILTGSFIICPRHNEHRSGKVPCHVNTGWCFICALGGTLICCEYCPTSFHAECLNIAPPEGNYMCEDCETGRLPLYGEMVWVKLGHYRWWPGLILHPSEIPDNILAVKHYQGEFVVRFFGQYDHYWVNRGRVFPFQEGDSGRISSQKSKIDEAFMKAMADAHKACQILKQAQAETEEDGDIASSLLPPLYVKLKVNKPSPNLVYKKADDDEHSLSSCDCDVTDPQPCGPLSACLNRMLLTECGPTCRAGDRCHNRAFERREYPKLVPYRTPHRGWGLKTLEEIKQGQFVIEYVGELIDEEEFRRRMARQHEVRDENFYYLTLDKDRMIDAGPKGNLARFMNHCCEPNCETQKWTVLGDVRVGLFALYDIPANTEVTFNYNLECAGIEKKRCFCGAKRCSGYIGAKPKQDETQPKKTKSTIKKPYKKRKPTEDSPSTIKKAHKPRTTQRSRPKELTEIEKDLLIIKNATNGLSSDSECSVRLTSIDLDERFIQKSLKRERVISSDGVRWHNGDIKAPSLKKIKLQEHILNEVGD